MKISNFGFYFNTKEKSFITGLSNKSSMHKAMMRMFPVNSPFIENIEYLIKPSKKHEITT